MLKIGLTGGIGSGKTTIARIIKTLGYPVYISDTKASSLMNTDLSVRHRLISLFGNDIYTQDGTLDKPRLATLIFCNEEALRQVNRIVHPVVWQDFERWCSRYPSPLLFFESAILFESGLVPRFDRVITVSADFETRVRRVMARDHTPREKVIERIRIQMDDSLKCECSDYILYNNGGQMVLQTLLDTLDRLLHLAHP